MTMLGEITHLQTLTDDLKALTMDPHKLPASSEQVIVDLKGSDCAWSYQTPPSSPSTTVSRKSSMCSSLNSVNSSDSRSSGSHCHSPTSHFRYRASSSCSSAPPQQTPPRLSSVSSHDSGFISQDAFQSKSPSPMPPESCVSASSQSVSEEPPPASALSSNNDLQQVKSSNGLDHGSALCLHAALLQLQDIHLHPSSFTSSSSSSSSPISSPSYWSVPPMWSWGHSGRSGEVPPLGSTPSSTVPFKKAQQEDRDAHEELARALARGLQLDFHGSSRDSVQGSSGYSSQTNTPCCSEDAITTQVSDCDYYSMGSEQDSDHHHHQLTPDYDKSSTMPRNNDISQSYRRMFQSKRPASTAGLPSNSSAVITPGVATIRRTPSSKPNLRRPSGGLGLGPIPIKPPMIPVKTPTVPEPLGGGGGGSFPGRAASEDGATPRTPLSPMTMPLSPLSGSWEGRQGEGLDPPTPPPQPSGRMSDWERRTLPELLEEVEYGEAEDYLVTIRRGVKLKKTATDDRSAPSIH